jgi:hypothetical protein
MITIILIISVVGLMCSAYCAFEQITRREYVVALLLLLITAVLVGIVYWIIVTDPERSLNSSNYNVEYAQVKSVTEKTIKLDRSNYKMPCQAITDKYPLNFSQFNVGDIVKYEFVSGDVSDYLVKIEKVK